MKRVASNDYTAKHTPDSRTMLAFSWADYAVALGAAALSFLVYFCTMAPTVTGEDSGELVGAAYFLGIPHPPGYPVWCMLAHPFTWLPWGTVAWRVAIASGFFASCTVFLTVLLIQGLIRNRWASFTAALSLAFSLEFWEQSVIAEAYTLNLFFIAWCLLILWQWHAGRRNRSLTALAIVFGLSMGNHYTMVLLGPLFALFILAAEGITLRRLGWYAALTLLSVGVMFLLYLYLPIRSLANPPVDWGNPETPSNFWDVVRRNQFSFMFSQYPRGIGRFVRQMGHMGDFWIHQFGFGLISLAGAAGLVRLIIHKRWHGILLTCVSLLVLCGAAYVQNFNFDKEWLSVMTVLGIPAYLCTAIGLGVFIAWIYPAPGGGAWNLWRIGFCLVAGLLVVFVPLIANYRINDKSSYYWAEDYARNLLNSFEPNAVYVPDTDHGSFPVMYLQAVDGLRPDVTLGRKYGYVEPWLLQDMPAEQREVYGEFAKRRYEPEIFAWMLGHTDRPVYFGCPPKLPAGSDVTFVPAGLVYRAVKPGETVSEKDYWAQYRWHTLRLEDARGDDVAELILYEIGMAHAQEDFRAGQFDAGLRHVGDAVSSYGHDELVLNNAGVLCARFGQYEPAQRYFEEALSLNPQSESVSANLQRVKTLRAESLR